MLRPTLLLICCGAALLLAGCGGGSSKKHLAAAVFGPQANQICSDLQTDEKPDLGSSTKAAVDRNLTRIDSALTKLNGLDPPAADQQRYQDLLTRFRRSVAFVRANQAHLIQLTRQLRKDPSDTTTLAQYQQLVSHFADDVRVAGSDAKALGLDVCSKGLTGA